MHTQIAEFKSCGAQVDGLLAGRPYQLRVRAANARGPGAWSNPSLTATATAPPPAPPPPTFGNRTVTSVRARWDAPEDDHGSPVTLYRCAGRRLFGWLPAHPSLNTRLEGRPPRQWHGSMDTLMQGKPLTSLLWAQRTQRLVTPLRGGCTDTL